ncbi:MAG: alpha/beta fold hydrolase [Candidatus Binataceae bacterium]|nr:alpha/beta fold hydrolase [Candidatus Binataceae bacterium]
MTVAVTQEQVLIDDVPCSFLAAGSGEPLLILHDELGDIEWRPWHAELAKRRRVLIPASPGFGVSAPVEWISSVRDLACFHARFLRELKIDRVDVIGLSFGGWIAAEMAANCASQFARMVLVAPFGIKPRIGDIRDIFLMSTPEYLQASLNHSENFDRHWSPQLSASREEARAEVARLGWSPYMHNPSLPHLLKCAGTGPALVIWGERDSIIPVSTAAQYCEILSNAKIGTLANCGHHPEIEADVEFSRLVRSFLVE